MANEHKAVLSAKGKKVAIVAARFNENVTRRLVDAAVDCLVRHGASGGEIDIYWVSGAFELPQSASRVIREGKFDGVVCLGALVRGDTAHFDVLASHVTRSLGALSTSGDTPIAFGVITADTMEQAVDRSGGKHGNLGWNSALALIDSMGLFGG